MVCCRASRLKQLSTVSLDHLHVTVNEEHNGLSLNLLHESSFFFYIYFYTDLKHVMQNQKHDSSNLKVTRNCVESVHIKKKESITKN